MAERAEELLAGSGWLPEPLRTPGRALPTAIEATDVETEVETKVETKVAPAGQRADGGEPALSEQEAPDAAVAAAPCAIAAE